MESSSIGLDATTPLMARHDEPTAVTPGLEKTRVGAPEPEDAMQRGVRMVRRGAGRGIDAADAVYGRIQRVTHAEGAGESGLAHVLEMGAVINAGDLLVTLALANSLFFSVQPTEARSKVALYLLITMVPFTLLAPLIGPLLDRLRGGRRFAMAVTALIRALLCLLMAKTIGGGGIALYPAAFGCLAAAKAYGVSRAAVIPRVLPPGTTLVRANSRVSMAALASTAVATPIGIGLGALGPAWTLGFAALIFFLGTWLAIRLPKVVDSNEGEIKAQLRKRDRGPDAAIAESMPDRRLRSVGPSVLLALRANATLRAFSGFLSLFMAFLVRTHPLGGLKNLTAVGVFAAAVAVGSGVGSALGAWFKSRAPEAIVTGSLALVSVTAIVAAFFYGLPMVLVLAAVTGLAPSLAKLSLDAMLQRDTLERVRTSAFARSETLLQFAWVIGGAIGLAMPSNGIAGVSIGAVGLSVMALLTTKSLYDLRSQSVPEVAS
jgi:Major Facilitator Superfamily